MILLCGMCIFIDKTLNISFVTLIVINKLQ